MSGVGTAKETAKGSSLQSSESERLPQSPYFRPHVGRTGQCLLHAPARFTHGGFTDSELLTYLSQLLAAEAMTEIQSLTSRSPLVFRKRSFGRRANRADQGPIRDPFQRRQLSVRFPCHKKPGRHPLHRGKPRAAQQAKPPHQCQWARASSVANRVHKLPAFACSLSEIPTKGSQYPSVSTTPGRSSGRCNPGGSTIHIPRRSPPSRRARDSVSISRQP